MSDENDTHDEPDDATQPESLEEIHESEKFIEDLVRETMADATNKALTNERIQYLQELIPGSTNDELRQLLQTWLLQTISGDMPKIDLTRLGLKPHDPDQEGDDDK